jgi:enamine deaminase RidA (YjgF/YER057c/UK114 family)
VQKQFTNPEELPCWPDFFSNIVAVEGRGAKTIYLAGQVGVDANKNFVAGDDLEAQTRQALKNVSIALDTVKATMADVVKLTIYAVNYKPKDATAIGKVIGEYFPEHKPACTLLGVQSLAEERFLIEIEAVAVLAMV